MRRTPFYDIELVHMEPVVVAEVSEGIASVLPTLSTKIGYKDRQQIATDIAALLAARDATNAGGILNREEKLPKRAGTLKVGPRY